MVKGSDRRTDNLKPCDRTLVVPTASEHLTRMLAEYLDCSDQALPDPGYRPREFARFEESVDPNFPDASTHVRWSDWEVSTVERFKSVDSAEYDEIVVCYCRYSPIEPEWKELPKIGVLQEGKL